ncbi:hypothetical protein CHUAL_007442 [Chamberlinius hualienensis]
MKSLIALLPFLVFAVSGNPIKSVGVAPTLETSFGYSGNEWLGNVRCTFYNQDDCDLSIHVNGRRIDSTTFNANEDVLISCLTALPTFQFIIHGFSYSDIGDYTCLEDTTKDLGSVWLSAAPIIEASGTFTHGQPATLTCNAPLDSPIYWILPGSASDHQSAVIVDSSNSQNASSTLTFTLGDSDHFAAYNCCIGLKDGQPPSPACTSYTVVDEESIGEVITTGDYSALQLQFTVDVRSTPLVDASTVVWQSCVVQELCTVLTRFNYDVNDDPSNHRLTSQLHIFDDGLATFYTFSVDTIDGSAQRTATFPLKRGSYYPQLTNQLTTVYYNEVDQTNTAVMKFVIDADPAPTVTWTKQQTRKESLGSETITTGGKYATTLTQNSATQWVATLAVSSFDFAEDDAIYTITAENDYGANHGSADATVGPNSLSFNANTNSTAQYSYTCQFEEFPFPPTYEINIVAPYPYSYTVVDTTSDQKLAQTAVTVEVGLDSQNTYFQITCTAFNPYHPQLLRTQTISEVVN